MKDKPGAGRPCASQWRKGCSTVQCLHVFKRLLQQTQLKLEIEKEGRYFYDRLFTPAVTLWCMLFQRLNHDHTLQAAVNDLHSGGADLLAGKTERPPSERIRSLATAAFSKVQGVLGANAHCLFRMSESRAGKVVGSPGLLHRPGDHAVSWSPSRHDLKHEGCRKEAIGGRLIVAQYVSPGFRTQWIYLFTTLPDASAHPACELVGLYGTRWQVELNIRFLKTQMGLHQLDCKTRDMAEKEWLCGLMAYNLVRVVMAAAAANKGLKPLQLSFSAARRLLVRWLLTGSSKTNFPAHWRKLLKSVACAKLPSRKKPRPPEPRAKRHKRETFPPLKGSRSHVREELRINNLKS